MQPASTSGASGGNNRQLKRWGPIAGVLAVVAIGGGVLLLTKDDDPKSVEGATTTVAAEETTPPNETTAPTDSGVAPETTSAEPAEVTFPFSFPQAV